jgi:coenzyme F420-reducing hydrogenase gamma subunit
MSPRRHRHSLAVWKFTSCDGCQLTLLDAERELLALAGAVRIAHFSEMTRATSRGPYDISLVEGSVTTPEEIERLVEIRAQTGYLVSIGACATAGGVQALRNFAVPGQFAATVYAHPEYLRALETSTPISAHVTVDYELHGCPINQGQLLEVLLARLAGRRPVVPSTTVCHECKARGTVCVLVKGAAACLGPVTRSGCGALCPHEGRGCYGCFGPAEGANTASLSAHLAAGGLDARAHRRLYQTFNVNAPAFTDAAARVAGPEGGAP